jgi:hypothetical protein
MLSSIEYFQMGADAVSGTKNRTSAGLYSEMLFIKKTLESIALKYYFWHEYRPKISTGNEKYYIYPTDCE